MLIFDRLWGKPIDIGPTQAGLVMDVSVSPALFELLKRNAIIDKAL
ncbi:MAG: hypothetical protein AAF968_16895 [Pseudomonadota bacterium]